MTESAGSSPPPPVERADRTGPLLCATRSRKVARLSKGALPPAALLQPSISEAQRWHIFCTYGEAPNEVFGPSIFKAFAEEMAELTRRQGDILALCDRMAETAVTIMPWCDAVVEFNAQLFSRAQNGESSVAEPFPNLRRLKHAGWIKLLGDRYGRGIPQGSDATEDLDRLIITIREPRLQIMGLPLVGKEALLGAIFLALSPDVTEFTRAMTTFVQGLHMQATVVLQNALNTELLLRTSMTDDLTQLPNRRYFNGTIEREVNGADRYGRPLALLYFDIDHFKAINDTHGHDGGDAVLKQVAGIVGKTVRLSDVPCRVGGEEFCIIAPGSDLAGAEHFAERLRATIEGAEITFKERVVPVTISIGVASWGQGMSAEDLRARADASMYKAKQTGRNRVCSG